MAEPCHLHGPRHPAGEVDPSFFTRRVAEMAIRYVRATDVIMALAQSSVGLLLIDAETWALPRIHQRLKEEVEGHRLSVRGWESRVSWSTGGGCFPQTAGSGNDLLRQAIDLMARAGTREGTDSPWLPDPRDAVGGPPPLSPPREIFFFGSQRHMTIEIERGESGVRMVSHGEQAA